MQHSEEGKTEVFELAIKWPGEEWDVEEYANEQAVQTRVKHLLSIHPQERPSFYCEDSTGRLIVKS